MVKLPTLAAQIMKRAIDIPLGDVKEPDYWEEAAEGEEVIAVLDDDLKRLCMVSCMTAEAADRLARETIKDSQVLVRRVLARDETVVAEIEQMTRKVMLLSVESELATSMFACSLRARYLDKMGDSQVKMCKGWKLVKVTETKLPLFAIPLPPGFGELLARLAQQRRR